MPIAHRITIEPVSRGARGQRYQVTYAGDVLIESSCNPEFDACRALVAQGITGKLAVWRRGAAGPCMTLDIERGAGLTISETDKEGPRLVRWRPFVAVDAQNAVSSRAVSPRIAADALAAAQPNWAPASGMRQPHDRRPPNDRCTTAGTWK